MRDQVKAISNIPDPMSALAQLATVVSGCMVTIRMTSNGVRCRVACPGVDVIVTQGNDLRPAVRRAIRQCADLLPEN